MRPIEFTCTATSSIPAEEISSRIARVEAWSDFSGYGIIPGIQRARYERKTEALVGSRIRVENRDGSRHVEEIVQWDPPRCVVLHLTEFSPPLCWLAERFVEEWAFSEEAGHTRVRRTFSMMSRGPVSRVALWIISLFLRRAIAMHLEQIGSVLDDQSAARRA